MFKRYFFIIALLPETQLCLQEKLSVPSGYAIDFAISKKNCYLALQTPLLTDCRLERLSPDIFILIAASFRKVVFNPNFTNTSIEKTNPFEQQFRIYNERRMY